MNSIKVIVEAENGIHARPASDLVKIIKDSAPAKVTLKANGKSVPGTSMLSLLTLGLKKGTELEVVAEGENEVAVAERVAGFIKDMK